MPCIQFCVEKQNGEKTYFNAFVSKCKVIRMKTKFRVSQRNFAFARKTCTLLQKDCVSLRNCALARKGIATVFPPSPVL